MRISASKDSVLGAVLLFAVSVSVHAQVVTGTLTGDGTAGRSITGIGFQPELVIVKVDDTGISGVARSSTMEGGTKAVWGNTGLLGNQITSLDANGFTVGNDIAVNALNACGGVSAPCVYYWTAFMPTRISLSGATPAMGTRPKPSPALGSPVPSQSFSQSTTSSATLPCG